MSDLLKEATRALKEQTEADSSDGRLTRARVMASLHQGKVKRRTRLALVLPLAACLAAGTAWGAATGRLPALFHFFSEAASPPAPPRTKPSSLAAPAVKKAPPAVEPVPADPAPAALEPLPPSPPEAKREPPAGVGSARSSSSASFRDADGDLYRLAHEAHFVQQDYSRALAAWDGYLRAAPSGRFATEARYNRAICLLRLGRDAEARAALEPFASGKLGYRGAEARQLLDELSK